MSSQSSADKPAYFFLQVIVTRFSRVTFNAAHKYLGLTSEILRTERAMNDIACHPLPSSFYEGGGLQYLRQRFDGVSAGSPPAEDDYFSFTHSPSLASAKSLSGSGESLNSLPLKTKNADLPLRTSRQSSFTTHSSPFRNQASRHVVHAGDLLSSTNHVSDTYPLMRRTFSISNTPLVPRPPSLTYNTDSPTQTRRAASLSGDDTGIDLREEVMSCIAKSIGLLQPPMSGSQSVDASPAFPPSDVYPDSRRSSGTFPSSFGSLSLLDLGDDSSSMTGGSSTAASSGGYMSGLDNEVEILFFAAGSTLARAGERNTGGLCPLFTESQFMILFFRPVLCHRGIPRHLVTFRRYSGSQVSQPKAG